MRSDISIYDTETESRQLFAAVFFSARDNIWRDEVSAVSTGVAFSMKAIFGGGVLIRIM